LDCGLLNNIAMGSIEYIPPAMSHAGIAEIPYQSNEQEVILIRQILAGRNDRFADLLQPHMNVLCRVVRSKMQHSSDIEDVVQEILLKAFRRLRQFRFEASFRTWLIRIAINEVLQWHRSRLHSGLPISDKQIGEMQMTEDSSSSPFKVYERNESVRCFYNAFVKLPETYQAVIRLRDLEQRSISETARFLHLSVPAVKTRHRRARHLMGRFLPTTKIKFTARQ
jgi:RNA polymerase sigma-70 factor (ECF subfamily)